MESPGGVGEIVRVGNKEEVSINQLGETVRQIAGSNSPIVHVPYKEAYGEGFEDMPRRVPNLEKAARVIGSRPPLNALEIVRRVVDFMSGPARETKTGIAYT